MDGNGTGGEGQATQAALLEAGRRLFARDGYDGTSVRAVTAEAGANLGAITYHFGSKAEFYAAVVRSVVEPFTEAVREAAHGPGAPLDRVERVVRTYFEYLGSHPELLRFLLQSLLRGEGPPPEAARRVLRTLGVLAEVVREGQGDGSIRPGPPEAMAISILSNPIHLHLMRGPLAEHAGLDLGDPAVRRVLEENAVRFARAGLAAPAGEEGR